MPSLACWMAVDLVKRRTAPLVAVYAAVPPGAPTRPAVDEMLMIDPPPACRIGGGGHLRPRKNPPPLAPLMRAPTPPGGSPLFQRGRKPPGLDGPVRLPD